jgi:hypothetical protein
VRVRVAVCDAVRVSVAVCDGVCEPEPERVCVPEPV